VILGDPQYDQSFNAIQIRPFSFVDFDQLMTTPHTRRCRYFGHILEDRPIKKNVESFRRAYPRDYADTLGVCFYKCENPRIGEYWLIDAILYQKQIHIDLIPLWERLTFDQAAVFLGLYGGI